MRYKKLQDWMLKQHGDPDMTDAIIINIQAWRSGSAYPTTQYQQQSLQDCILHQDREFIHGRIYIQRMAGSPTVIFTFY